MDKNITYRDTVTPNDIKKIEEIVKSTKYFTKEEENIAVELIQERLNKGPISGYNFLFIEKNDTTIGYSCFGLIPCSYISFDLYWIVIHNDYRGKGYGKLLLKKTEEYIKKNNGYQIIVETSSKKQYESTRKFYKNNGYKKIAYFKDFYNFKDGKIVYNKILK